jgi:hypothetical protein
VTVGKNVSIGVPWAALLRAQNTNVCGARRTRFRCARPAQPWPYAAQACDRRIPTKLRAVVVGPMVFVVIATGPLGMLSYASLGAWHPGSQYRHIHPQAPVDGPENSLKFVASLMLGVFGLFRVGKGNGAEWPCIPAALSSLTVRTKRGARPATNKGLLLAEKYPDQSE